MNTYTEEEVIELLKQQRHLCQVEWNKRSHHDDTGWYIHCEDIMNADAPELKKTVEILNERNSVDEGEKSCESNEWYESKTGKRCLYCDRLWKYHNA